MGGANIIKRQSHEAAMNLFRGGEAGRYSPTDLSIGGAGGLSWVDGQPVYTPDAAQQGLSQTYQGLLANLQSGLGALGGAPVQLGQNAMGASQSLFDQLNAFDPLEAAQTRFGQLQSVIAPQQSAQREAMTAQLLRQGRLGGTSGDAREAALAAAQRASDIQLANSLYGEAEQSRRNMLADALTAGGVGAQQYGGLFQQLPQLSAGIQNVNLQPFSQLLGMSQGIGAQALQRDLGISQGINAYNSSMGGPQASQGKFGQMLPGLIQGGLMAAGTIFGGPMGGAAAAALGGALAPSSGAGPSPAQGQAAMFGPAYAGPTTNSFWNTMGG